MIRQPAIAGRKETFDLDAERFDALTRAIESRAPRRAALAVLGGGLGTLLSRFGFDELAARKKREKKRKKKCKGKKKCGKKCIPKGNCCKSSDCGADEQCCRGACLSIDFCCADSDCFDIYTCEGGLCTCKADPSDIPCNAAECCDPASEVCAFTEATDIALCQSGGCPAGADVCTDETVFFCGAGDCVCTTSVEERTVCTDFAGVCMTCTSDAQCADALDQDAVCITINGTCTCDGGETTACIAVGCPSGVAAARRGGRGGPQRDLPRLGR